MYHPFHLELQLDESQQLMFEKEAFISEIHTI